MLWAIALLALATLLRSNVRWPELLVRGIDHSPELGYDFTHHYLPQARQLFSSPTPVVVGWLNPPLLALLLCAFAPFSDTVALALWTSLQMALVCVLVVLCRNVLRRAGRWTSWAGAFGLVALSLPVMHAIKWGQVSLAVSVVAVWAMTRRTRLAALTLGGLASVKLYPILYGLVWWCRDVPRAEESDQERTTRERQPRGRTLELLAWLSATVLTLGVLVPLVTLGPRTTAAFGKRLVDATVYLRRDDIAYLGGQAIRPTMIRFFVNGFHVGLLPEGGRPRVASLGSPRPGSVAAMLHSILFSLPSIAIGLYSWHRLRACLPLREGASVLMLAVGLAFPPGWHHYFAFLPFALATGLARDDMPSLVLAGIGFLASAFPLLLLSDVPGIYFRASLWGSTTFAALAAWAAVIQKRKHPSWT